MRFGFVLSSHQVMVQVYISQIDHRSWNPEERMLQSEIALLRSKSPSRKCPKLHTVEASNNWYNTTRSLSPSPLAALRHPFFSFTVESVEKTLWRHKHSLLPGSKFMFVCFWWQPKGIWFIRVLPCYFDAH